MLDEDPPEEPDFDPEENITEAWWQRFAPKGNDAYRAKDGLTLIPDDLFENIVVKTKPFETILSRLIEIKLTFSTQHFLLTGGFGFGKTTLLDYLSYYLLGKEIFTVPVSTTRQPPTSGGYIETFQTRLKTKLIDELDKLGLEQRPTIDPKDDIDSVHRRHACSSRVVVKAFL